jgi:MFS family permease
MGEMGPRDDFRDRLLDAQEVTETYRERYQREVRAMLHKQLTVPGKVVYAVVLAMSVAMTVGFVCLAITSSQLPALARASFGMGAVFAAAWAWLAAQVLRRGSFDIRKLAAAQASLTWVFVVLMVTVFMVLSGEMPDKAQGTLMVVWGLVFLVSAAAFLITARVQQSELNTREKLLEIECRLAELTERLGPGAAGRPTGEAPRQ